MLIKQMHKKCDISNHWYFLDKEYQFEPYLCNVCHDLMQETMNFNDIVFASVKGIDYRIHFGYMSKDDAISIMKNVDLNGKTGLL